jgi:hypothetical protein
MLVLLEQVPHMELFGFKVAFVVRILGDDQGQTPGHRDPLGP